VELVLEGQVMQHVVTTASYTFARATDRATGRTLNNSPAHLGKVRLTAPLRGSWLLMGAEAQYISRRTAIGGEVLNPRCLVNATLLGKGPRSPLGFSVTAYNVFDVRYGDPDAGFPNVVTQDGRTFQLTLTTGF
jgi:iron complex outermembrane receptor protein